MSEAVDVVINDKNKVNKQKGKFFEMKEFLDSGVVDSENVT